MDKITLSQTKENNFIPEIKKEIAFLNMRIEKIKSHHTPNREMLRNFESMLKSREDVMHKIHNPSTLSRISRHMGQ